MTQSILVPSAVSDSVAKRLSRLAKKAGVTFEKVKGTSRVFRKTVQLRSSRLPGGEVHTWQVIAIDTHAVLECDRFTVGEMPRTNGFEFLGKITHTEAGNILSLAPQAQGGEFPSEWRTAKPTCDHCGTKRARSETFLVRTPEGKVTRVGRNCLADFLMGSAAGMIALSEFEDSLREEQERDPDEYSSGSSHWGVDPFWYLACAVSEVERNGFVSKTAEGPGRPCTAGVAMGIALPYRGSLEGEKDWQAAQPSTDHQLLAAQMVQWLSESSDNSDYFFNLRTALQVHTVVPQTSGLIASLPTAFSRAMGKIAERKAVEESPDAGAFGTIGERAQVTATVLAVIVLESEWGTKFLVKMRTNKGHDLVTFTTSSNSPRSSDVDKKYVVTGTVKEHGSYKGRSQTTLTRCVWQETND